jgi:beta-glucosidase
MIKFPDSFFWGASTSSYQVEGNNTHSDWWKWEKEGKLKYKSGSACNQYELFRHDYDLAKSLNHNAHRLSIEWSRIEPRENEFSYKEIKHYISVIDALRERKIEPVVTLHHFTNPSWFTDKGGWLSKDALEHFLRYVEKIVSALCDKVHIWVTINEPMVYAYHAYVRGAWPPQKKSLSNLKRVGNVLINAHIKAYGLIYDIYKKRNLPHPFISIAKHMQAFEMHENSLRNKFAVRLRDKVFNFGIIEKAIREKALDFIGLNYYTRQTVSTRSWSMRSLLTDNFTGDEDNKKNSLGWDIYPGGLYKISMKLKKYNLPIFILENGICTTNDSEREEFIIEHLKSVHKAIMNEVKIIGYLYWSLIDNYEWHEGFNPRFGLIDVNYSNFKRTIRDSARKFALICKTGTI